MCLDTLGKKDDAPLGLYQCHGQGGNQVMKLATSLLFSYSEGDRQRKQRTVKRTQKFYTKGAFCGFGKALSNYLGTELT